MFKSRLWHQDQYPENTAFVKASNIDYFATMQTFEPETLTQILHRNEMNVIRCGGLGSLARYIDAAYTESHCK